MGQYHSIINLDKRAGYLPRSIDSFQKLMEQACTVTPCAALIILLSDPNGWGGERIALIGDYAQDDDLDNSPYPASELYERLYLSQGIKNVGWLARKVLTESGIARFETETFTIHDSETRQDHQSRWHKANYGNPKDPESAPGVVVVNHDKQERLSPHLFGDKSTLLELAQDCHMGGTGAALTVLLAASCKGGRRGGGDIASSSPLVGSWAGDRISVLPEHQVDRGLQDISARMREVFVAADEARYEVHGSQVCRLSFDHTSNRWVTYQVVANGEVTAQGLTLWGAHREASAVEEWRPDARVEVQPVPVD